MTRSVLSVLPVVSLLALTARTSHAEESLLAPVGVASRPALASTDSYEVWMNRFPPAPERDQRETERKPEPPNRKESLSAGLLVGTGAPGILNGGIMAKLTRYASVGANLGMMPTVHFQLYGDATVSYRAYDAYARLHPFGGGFFVGSGIGYATWTATLVRNVAVPAVDGVMDAQSFEVRGEGSVRSLVVIPQIGYQQITRSGFTWGFDAGAIVPISSDVSLSTNLPAEISAIPGDPAGDATTKVRDTLRRVGQQVLPSVNVRVGWMF